MNIYVGNLPYSTTEADLQQMFGQHGQVTGASIIIDRDTGRSRGFGFVEMASEADAQKAIQELNGREIKGRAIRVSPAQEGGGGGGGGRGRSGGGGGGGGGGRRW